MEGLGIKNLTETNWLEPDDANFHFVTILPDGTSRPISGDEWVQWILKPKIEYTVPKEVQVLFEVARGAMLYGYMFYPLFTLGLEQLFRVAESAVIQKCALQGCPKSQNTFERKIDWLGDNSLLDVSERESWHRIRQMRNLTSHPEFQMILPPGNTVKFLTDITEKVNNLFVEK